MLTFLKLSIIFGLGKGLRHTYEWYIPTWCCDSVAYLFGGMLNVDGLRSTVPSTDAVSKISFLTHKVWIEKKRIFIRIRFYYNRSRSWVEKNLNPHLWPDPDPQSCCCLPCNHCNIWTWGVEEILLFVNRLCSTRCGSSFLKLFVRTTQFKLG